MPGNSWKANIGCITCYCYQKEVLRHSWVPHRRLISSTSCTWHEQLFFFSASNCFASFFSSLSSSSAAGLSSFFSFAGAAWLLAGAFSFAAAASAAFFWPSGLLLEPVLLGGLPPGVVDGVASFTSLGGVLTASSLAPMLCGVAASSGLQSDVRSSVSSRCKAAANSESKVLDFLM